LLRDKALLTFNLRSEGRLLHISVKAKSFPDACQRCGFNPKNCELISTELTTNATDEYLKEQKAHQLQTDIQVDRAVSDKP